MRCCKSKYYLQKAHVQKYIFSGPYLQSKTKSLHFRRINNCRLYEKVYHFFYHLACYQFRMLPVIPTE